MTDWNGKIKIALITGQHPFVVQDLQRFFRSIDEVDCYPQHMEDFVNDIGSARHVNRETFWGHPHLDYDVLVFYNMQRRDADPEDRFQKREIEVVDLLGDTTQGILMLHHGSWLTVAGSPGRTSAASRTARRPRSASTR